MLDILMILIVMMSIIAVILLIQWCQGQIEHKE